MLSIKYITCFYAKELWNCIECLLHCRRSEIYAFQNTFGRMQQFHSGIWNWKLIKTYSSNLQNKNCEVSPYHNLIEVFWRQSRIWCWASTLLIRSPRLSWKTKGERQKHIGVSRGMTSRERAETYSWFSWPVSVVALVTVAFGLVCTNCTIS